MVNTLQRRKRDYQAKVGTPPDDKLSVRVLWEAVDDKTSDELEAAG